MYQNLNTKSKKYTALIGIILLFAAVTLFFTSYYIGTQNRNRINKNDLAKGNSEKNVMNKKLPKDFKDAKEFKEAVLPKTPGRNENVTLMVGNDGQKVAYLTFDDGPSPNNTPRVLDILKRENIKATFFIIGKNAENNPGILRRERDQGETIGMHSYIHVPAIIYKNPQAYLDDLQKCRIAMTNVLGINGYDRFLIRFPDGSSTVKHQPGFRESIANAGYHYVDWNALNGDAETSSMAPPEYLLHRFQNTVGKQHHVVILMHDAATKKTTVETLPSCIQYLRANGYIFKTIPKYQS